ncbi:MAG: HAD family phosphatase, partial [bacterium]|nr:HAD family phosphatase [bacterium]
MTSHLRAILWDLDGTLIDSEPYWMRTETELVAEHGGEWTLEDAAACIGNSLAVTAERMAAKGVPLAPEAIVGELFSRMDHLIRTSGLPWKPGARELLEEARDAGIPQALVTMSYGPYVQAAVESVPDGVFAAVRMGDSVERPKPAPDIYLAATADLGLHPSECLALEDSGPGAQAILAAGVTPVVVPGEGDVPVLAGTLRWPT